MDILKISLLLFMLFISKLGLSQCSVEVDQTDNIIMVIAERETIHKTEDFENGYLTAGVRLINTINKKVETNDDVQYGIFVYVGAFGKYDEIKPRRISLNFLGGLQISLEAETMEKLDLVPNAHYYESYFRLNKEQIKMIGQLGLYNIAIRDNRTEQILTSKPYEYILKEQLDCILKSINRQ